MLASACMRSISLHKNIRHIQLVDLQKITQLSAALGGGGGGGGGDGAVDDTKGVSSLSLSFSLPLSLFLSLFLSHFLSLSLLKVYLIYVLRP